MRTFLRTVAFTGVVAVAWLVPAAPGLATHPSSTFYPKGYSEANDHQLIYFDDDFPGGRVRTRIADAARQWTRLGRRMYFTVRRSPSIESSVDRDRGPFGNCPAPSREGRRVSLIHWWRTMPAGSLGITSWCRADDRLKTLESFRLGFNAHARWYSGTGNSRVRNRKTDRIENRWDLWSIATHELGHATGWNGHFAFGSRLCNLNNPGRFQTMCEGNPVMAGTELIRTLGGHDKSAFEGLYGPR